MRNIKTQETKEEGCGEQGTASQDRNWLTKDEGESTKKRVTDRNVTCEHCPDVLLGPPPTKERQKPAGNPEKGMSCWESTQQVWGWLRRWPGTSRVKTSRRPSCSERSVISRGETALQRKAQKEDFLSDRWCEVNHLCVSKKCVTPDTFPLLRIASTAGTFSQRCSPGLSHSLYPKSSSPCPRQLLDRNKTQRAAGRATTTTQPGLSVGKSSIPRATSALQNW